MRKGLWPARRGQSVGQAYDGLELEACSSAGILVAVDASQGSRELCPPTARYLRTVVSDAEDMTAESYRNNIAAIAREIS